MRMWMSRVLCLKKRSRKFELLLHEAKIAKHTVKQEDMYF